jgi:predicted DNA-binding transcriptional regulator AlpA
VIAMRKIEYVRVLRPSVDRLAACGKLLIGTKEMAEFLGLSRQVVIELASTDRLPTPIRLGGRGLLLWSVIDLLKWVESGCPRADQWIKISGRRIWHYLR